MKEVRELKEKMISYIKEEIKFSIDDHIKFNYRVKKWEIDRIESMIEMLDDLDIINYKESNELSKKLEELENLYKKLNSSRP